MHPTTLLLGIGNLVLTDDGFGVHVVRRLQERGGLPAGARLLDGGTLGLAISHELVAAARLIVFDAARLDAAPGTLRCFVDAEMDGFLRARGRSAHQVGLADLLDTTRLSDDLPERRALIAVQPDSLDWGEHLSAAVEAAVEPAIETARDLLRRWSQPPA